MAPVVGDIVSIRFPHDPVSCVGRVVERSQSDDLALYRYKLLINPDTNYLPYWVHVERQTSVDVLLIGEKYRLCAGMYEGEDVCFSRLLQKAPIALVTREGGSAHFCPASVLEPKSERASYHEEERWK